MSMFTLPSFSLPLPLPSFLAPQQPNKSYRTIAVPPVPTHDVETLPDKRPRTLKHLLKANHATHAILYHGLQFHNHVVHILGSAYILGGTAEHLNDVYEKEAEGLEGWRDAPGEVGGGDWREWLGRREYQRAFVDFFEDQLVARRYDWKAVLDEYMFGGEEPLVNGLVSGLAHPMIHLGYAYELDSRTVAIEALAMAACCYGKMHEYIDDPGYTRPSPVQSGSLLEILEKVRGDKRFDGLYEGRSGDITKVLAEREDAFLEYWNAWDLTDPTKQFEESQKVATAILVGTEDANDDARFDFFFVHLLTSSHAVRILLPVVPAKFHISLVRQWWLFTLAVYIAQTRPEIQLDRIDGYDVQGKNWKLVVDQALGGAHSLDAHFVKALRALKVAAETWGDQDGFYLKAAVRFAEGFTRWGGFASSAEDDVAYAYPAYL